MTYQVILDAIQATTLHRCATFEQANIRHFVASDLMSDVLTVDEENFVLLTSLASEQVARTADIVCARGIILVNNKQPQGSLLELAKNFDISLLSTPLRMFHVCAKLSRALEVSNL